MSLRRSLCRRARRTLFQDREQPTPPPASEIEFVAAGTSAAAATNGVTPGLPAGIVAGDVLICAAAMRGSGAPSMSGDWTQGVSPQGYVSPAALTPVAGYLMNAASSGTSPSTITQIFGDGSGGMQSFGTVGGWTTNAGGRIFSAEFLVVLNSTGTVYEAFNGGAGGQQITVFLEFQTGADGPDNGELLFGMGLDDNQIANLRFGMYFLGTDTDDSRIALNNTTIWSSADPIFANSTRYVLAVVLDTPHADNAQRIRVYRYDGTNFTLIGTPGTVTQNESMSFTSGTDQMIVGAPVGTNSGKVGAMFWYQGAASAALAQNVCEQLWLNNDAAPSVGGTADTSLTWWWHRYTGSDPSTVINRTSSDCMLAGIVAYRNCVAAGDPIEDQVSWFDADGDASTDIEIGTLDLETVSPDAMAVFIAAEAGNSTLATPSGGVTWVEEFEQGTSLGSDTRLSISNGLLASPGSIAATTTAGSSGRHVGAGLALTPEA